MDNIQRAMEEVLNDLYASHVALERITTSMLKVLTPLQLDAVKDMVFTQNGMAEEIIGKEQKTRMLREKRIQRRASDLLSFATPRISPDA